MSEIVLAGGLSYGHLARPSWFSVWDEGPSPSASLVLRFGGDPVSVIRLFNLGPWLGLGGVYTLEEARGQGFARELLGAIEHPHQALHSERRTDNLYERCGFEFQTGSLWTKGRGSLDLPEGWW